MSYSNKQLIDALEAIFKADRRTKNYTIDMLSTPDGPPTNANVCPLVSVLPVTKGRQLTRINPNAPYICMPAFAVVLWECSAKDLRDAADRLDAMEENVYPVLLENITVGGKVSTSVIGDSEYSYFLHEESFFVSASIPFIMEQFQ